MVYVIGTVFSLIIGISGHYYFKLSGNNKLVGFLFSTNESLYAHLKLGYTPMLLWMIVENMVIINNTNIIAIKGISFLVFTLIITLPYLIFNKLFKIHIPAINITSFILGIIASYITTFLLINMIYLSNIIKFIGICYFILVIASYFISKIKIKKRVSKLS